MNIRKVSRNGVHVIDAVCKCMQMSGLFLMTKLPLQILSFLIDNFTPMVINLSRRAVIVKSTQRLR